MRWIIAAILMVLISTAVLADVSHFPAPLVEENEFDGYIVVTDENGGLDYLATTKLMNRLFQETTVVEVPDAKESKRNYRLYDENGHDFVEGGEMLSTVVSEVTADHWDALATGETSNQEGTYTYYQTFYPGDAHIRFSIANAVPDDPDQVAAAYLNFDAAGNPAYTYRIYFDPAIESKIDGDDNYALDDLEGMEFDMLGKTYIISKTDHAGLNDLKLTLVAASEELTLREGETKVVTLGEKQHEVTVIFVSDPASGGSPEVKLSFDGEMIKGLSKLDTYNVDDDTTIYVRDIMVNARDAVVDLRFGASKMILHDDNVTDGAYAGNEWEVDEENVDGTDVKFVGTDEGLVNDGTFYLESIEVKWSPEEVHYVATGQRLSEIIEDQNKIFGQSFDISYDGANPEHLVVEGLQLKPKGKDEYHLLFTNRLGQQLDVPLFYDNSGSFTRFGDDSDELHLREGYNISKTEHFIVTSVGDGTGYTHHLEYTGSDVSENYLEFRDHGSGQEFKLYYPDGASSTSIPLWGDSYLVQFSDTSDDLDIQVDLDDSGTITGNETPVITTQYGLRIYYDIEGTYAFRRMETLSYKKEECLTCGSPIDPETILLGIGSTVKTTLANVAFNLTVDRPTWAPLGSYHERMRLTVEDDSNEIDLMGPERCLDGGFVDENIATEYDGNASITGALTASGLHTLAQVPANSPLSEIVKGLYFNHPTSGCYYAHTTGLKFMLDLNDDTDDDMGTTGYGQKLLHQIDTNGPDSVTIYNEENQVEHMIIFYGEELPALAPVSEAKAKIGSVETKLDSEVSTIDKDMIVIGGPCTNKVAADLIGNAECTLGYEAGKARIVLTEENGHNILIIAGFSDADTYLAVQALLEQPEKLRGFDLEVSGTLDNLKVAEYVVPEGAPVTPPPEPEVEEEIEEEPVAVTSEPVVCEASNDETGTFAYSLSKLGMTLDKESSPRVTADGTKGTVIYEVSEPFKAQLGVDWLQYVLHIHEGDCAGPEVTALTFKWEDGDGDKEQSFTLPREGCYCLRVDAPDITVDDADAELTSEPLELVFSTASAEDNLLTGGVIFGGWFPAEPLNDMSLWG
jgi:hypothetical protein